MSWYGRGSRKIKKRWSGSPLKNLPKYASGASNFQLAFILPLGYYNFRVKPKVFNARQLSADSVNRRELSQDAFAQTNGVRMKIGFIIYDGMTSLDFIGVYDPLTRLKTMGLMPDLQWEICAFSREVRDNAGLVFIPTQVKEALQNYDLVVVPGGFSSRTLVNDTEFLRWLKTAEPCRMKVSVCTGSLLLGAAGFLKGKKATTHPTALNELRKFCSSVVEERIVDEGDVITARGVTSSIDLGLYLCEKLAGPEAKEQIRQQMDYLTKWWNSSSHD
jgi:transcriptional regulator GlxA family with amidase domain